MSYFVVPGSGERVAVFGQGEAEARALAMGLPFLGAIPLDPMVRVGGDTGAPVVVANAQSEIAASFRRIAGALAQRVSIQTLGAEVGARA
jgi:ATP-binding protein involved in chromosome partitioning